MKEIEIRCPVGPQRLFLKLRIEGSKDLINPDLNCMELSCQDCCRSLRKEGHGVFRVLHRYAVNAELIETVVVWDNQSETIYSEWS
jgi:hypothetical protein